MSLNSHIVLARIHSKAASDHPPNTLKAAPKTILKDINNSGNCYVTPFKRIARRSRVLVARFKLYLKASCKLTNCTLVPYTCVMTTVMETFDVPGTSK